MSSAAAPSAPPTTDALFATVERLHGERPWGRVLDAGTGPASLAWLLGRPTEAVVAVTGGVERATALQAAEAGRLRPADRLVVGNWQDPLLLHGERFDVVVADYLLGAIDGWAPYFQDRLFPRLARTCRPGGRLYVVGLAPFDEAGAGEGGRLVCEVARLRDACILLAGHRCYREYPRDWVHRALEAAGFAVQESVEHPIRFGAGWFDSQLQVCERKLPFFRDLPLQAAMKQRIAGLRARAGALLAAGAPVVFGHDYVVAADAPGA